MIGNKVNTWLMTLVTFLADKRHGGQIIHNNAFNIAKSSALGRPFLSTLWIGFGGKGVTTTFIFEI
jgi:hypothetical protein